MRATELRIGNWIYDPLNKTEFQIDVFLGSEYCTNKCEFDSQEFDAKIEDCKPIPLTEEWLLKFGFEKDETFYYKRNHLELKEMTYEDGFDAYCCDSDFSVFMTEIQYLHQLQNLYFALTNEELTL